MAKRKATTVTDVELELDLGPVFHRRWMVQHDLPAVAAVDAGLGLPDTTAAMAVLLGERNKIGMVVEDAAWRVVGHFAYELAEHNTVRPLWVRGATADANRVLAEGLTFKALNHRRTLVVPVAGELRTDTVRQLCRLDEIPAGILADALEDAGCGDGWLLVGLRHHDDVNVARILARAVAFGLNFAPPKTERAERAEQAAAG